jgi:hypothetical protein
MLKLNCIYVMPQARFQTRLDAPKRILGLGNPKTRLSAFKRVLVLPNPRMRLGS